MLSIKNLHASIEGKDILKGLNLEIKPGEVHAIMGPNGSGKSTLGNVLAGRDIYEVTEGDILLDGESILEHSPEDRAREGIFLAFQYPVEIPGVSNINFLKTAINDIRESKGQPALEAREFLKMVKEKQELVEFSAKLANRSLNEGFSGGEKKRNEILQLLMLEPKFGILDEIDSGLDIDALKVVSNGINSMRGENFGALIITHYQRLLNYITPDFVHVIMKGKVVKSGGKELAERLEAEGYEWIKEELGIEDETVVE